MKHSFGVSAYHFTENPLSTSLKQIQQDGTDVAFLDITECFSVKTLLLLLLLEKKNSFLF